MTPMDGIPHAAGDDRLEQIRDIILGSQRREQEARLERLDASIADVRAAVDQLRSGPVAELSAALQALDRRLQSLTKVSEEERVQLGRRVQELDARVTRTVDAAARQASEAAGAVAQELAELKERLQQDLRSTQESALRRLDEELSGVRATVVGREQIAQLLRDLGDRIAEAGPGGARSGNSNPV